MVNTDDAGNEIHIDAEGNTRRLGLIPADMTAMRAAPQYTEAYPLIPESDWPEAGDVMDRFMPFVENQGQYGSCGGHGASAAFTAAWNYAFAELTPSHRFSPVFLYGLTNGGRDNGSRPEDLRNALLAQGCCLISTVPEGSIYSSRYPKAAFTEAARFKPAQALVITTFEEMASAIIRKQPVFSGIFIGNRFTPDANGVVPEWDRSQVGGHCTAQLGLAKIGGVWGCWTLNSWGTQWGKAGWCWLPRSYFDGGLPAFAAVAVVSCLPDPQDPTPTPAPQ